MTDRKKKYKQSDFQDPSRDHKKWLIGLSILMKIIVMVFTIHIAKSFVDAYDFTYYYYNIDLLFSGMLPYVDYSIDYPIFALIPMIIAYIPSQFLGGLPAFIFIFQSLMIICDIIIVMCIYDIVYKIYKDHRISLIASIIYLLSFSTSYFIITKYDAFPTCLMMVGLQYIICNDSTNSKLYGYISIISGIFSKFYPVIILPFILIYNSKTTSLKNEMVSLLKIAIPFVLILLVPLYILNPKSIDAYIFATGGGNVIYANTFTFTIYTWIYDIFKFGISSTTISSMLYVCGGLIGLFLLYYMYKLPNQNPIILIKIIALTLITIIMCTKFHSPQYVVWYTPLICILVSNDVIKFGSWMLLQIIMFINFPYMFGKLYINTSYLFQYPTPNWQFALVLFTLEYLLLIGCVWIIIDPKSLFTKEVFE